MRATNFVIKAISWFAGSVILSLALNANAGEYEQVMKQLTEEQRQLLNDYHQPTHTAYNNHSLNSFTGQEVSLMRLQITAETNPMQGAALQLGASYRSWGVNSNFSGLTYNTISTEFTVKAAQIQRALDFSESIREKSEFCPEKLIDKMVIDGAVSLNFAW